MSAPNAIKTENRSDTAEKIRKKAILPDLPNV
jgi:hypothetical protein